MTPSTEYPQVLAVDPGGTCGWAMYPRDLAPPFWPGVVSSGQMPAAEFLDAARGTIGRGWFVLVERFTITATTAKLTAGGAHDALDVIGVLKYLCRWAGASFVMQTPGEAKKFVTDPQLKALGLWRPGQDHARDAVRHLVRGLFVYGAMDLRDDLARRLAP